MEKKSLIIILILTLSIVSGLAETNGDFGSVGINNRPKLPTSEEKAAEEMREDRFQRLWTLFLSPGVNFGALIVSILALSYQLRERKKEVKELKRELDHFRTQIETHLQINFPPLVVAAVAAATSAGEDKI